MAVRIKTISNDIKGAEKAAPGQHHAHQANKAPHDSRQTNKILELEWEALGKKLNKTIEKGPGDDVEKLYRQLREKDEMLRQAESRIASLKKQLSALQDKQRAHEPAKNAVRQQRQFPRHSQKQPQKQQHEAGRK